MRLIKTYLFIFITVAVLISCGAYDGNDPGTEYMPDMAHSIAFEANYYDYYYYNTWGSEADYYEMAKPRKPVSNTIARGHAGIGAGDTYRAAAMQGFEWNGSVPYEYEDTDVERLRAENEIITNPYPITANGLARGKNLYTINCGICHGDKGDGEGWLYAEANKDAKYGAAPAVLINDTFTLAGNGRMYHAIMHGKNVMGSYQEKLSYEERWQVIHYIRSLQAKTKSLQYDEEKNDLNKGALPLTDWKLAYAVSDHDDDSGAAHRDDEDHEADHHETNDDDSDHHH